MDFWNDIFYAQLTIAGHDIAWREVVGNLFGLASAFAGMRRRVWAWPVGIIGNALLFTVFMGVWFHNPQEHSLFGQAARQVFFIITSVYGWWQWSRSRRTRGAGGPAITPRWATAGERLAYLGAWVGGVLVLQWVFAQVGAGWPAPRWYYWTDAWIFVGSIIATYAMARGWTDFWLCWIAVDVVGVPLLWHSGYYPSALWYAGYSVFVTVGFLIWRRAAIVEAPSGGGPNLAEPAPAGTAGSAGEDRTP
ncbi:nicotinamide riboside transporter PnuC [Ornithinicoccus hortensis]|uniref:Nicotinamide mononucleotide transporter n=1 Tax=Ornithinicoccus hortensis TaxID=82346 RepID=A0A542YSH4_9MICO|nr:nicotinamide riboside transporter PnuC [Ornithinicoccus hortensis]TQL51052.1 nicotinamide mononucleotide transporter [Ornithinicoccus hortensis]